MGRRIRRSEQGSGAAPVAHPPLVDLTRGDPVVDLTGGEPVVDLTGAAHAVGGIEHAGSQAGWIGGHAGSRRGSPELLPPSRRLFGLIDLENLCYDCTERPGAVLDRVWAELVRLGTPVLVEACANPWLISGLVAHLARLGIRAFSVPLAPDAADRELVRRLRTDRPASCDTVVIASGDHSFALPASRLRAGGVQVVVLSYRGKLSRALRRVADRVVLLDPPGLPTTAA